MCYNRRVAPATTLSMNSEASARAKAIRSVLLRVLFLNALVAAAKLIVGVLTGTLSMIADGFHSFLDSLSNVVGLVGITMASRPPDADHPYGHHKYETLASLVIGVLVFYTAVEIFKESLHRIMHHKAADVGPLNIVVMLATLLINVMVTRYEARAAEVYKSDVLRADSLQTRSDVLVSSGVLAAIVLVWAGIPIMDPVAAFCVTAAIFYSAWLIFERATHVLSDQTFLRPQDIADAALGVEGVHSVEKIRSRGTDALLSVDLHVRVDPDISVTEAHRITHGVRAAVEQATGATDVVIHTEPARQPADRS